MNYVSAEEVIALHDFILKRYAGVAGMPDPGRAEAIVTRVINREFYEDTQDVFELAATYWVAIARGHIFADGNKRTALNVTMLFLKRNAVLVHDMPELVELTVRAATGEVGISHLTNQLRTFFSSH